MHLICKNALVRKQILLEFVNNPPLGLPPVPVPADNPVTEEKVSLGRRLFFDRRLSINDTFHVRFATFLNKVSLIMKSKLPLV